MVHAGHHVPSEPYLKSEMDVQLDSYKWVWQTPFCADFISKIWGTSPVYFVTHKTGPCVLYSFFEIQKYHMGSYGWNWFLCIFKGISLSIETDLNRLADAKLLFGWVISVPRRENLLFDPFHYLFLSKPSQFFLKLRFERLAIFKHLSPSVKNRDRHNCREPSRGKIV